MMYKTRVFIVDGIAFIPRHIGELFKSVELSFNEQQALLLLDGYGVEIMIEVECVA